MRRFRSRFVAIGALLAVSVVVASACEGAERSSATTATTAPGVTATPDPIGFAGYVKSPARDVASVSLPTVAGEETPMVPPAGGLLIVYFGYTQCPDVCPLTLGVLKRAVAAQTPADSKRVHVAMITVDPSRDTDKVFGTYLHGYFPSGLALRTDDPVRLRAAADGFGADYSIRATADGKRQVDHSAELYVVDDHGKIVLAWPYGLGPEPIARDLQRLLAGERPGVS